jgi:nucleoside-diphosphate-sugar epimerase
LRLLLDEMYPYRVAEQLRARGHDVVAVSERPALRGLPDRELFAVARDERRALASDDVGFRSIEAECRTRGAAHHGVVYTSSRRFPRGEPGTVGKLTRALDAFLSSEAVALADSPSFSHWLR